MRMYDLIIKKKQGSELTDEEIVFMIDSYVKEEIPDYQMSAMLMAICFNGMTGREVTSLTKAMANSGEIVDLSRIEGLKVDKHSTGGVGDKTTLIIGPMVAAVGVKVAKMSGRGLGHTGGTIDKMEAIPNLRTSLPIEQFFDTVKRVGISVMGQTADLAPADKKLYALRDVTATVDSIPLIAASVMSKKLAAGSDCILLDVTTGSGAFMKDFDDALELAKKMVSIGEDAGKKTAALVTNMDVPLGNAIGNAIEIKEVVDTLNGRGPEDLTEICIHLAANMLFLANKGGLEECAKIAKKTLEDGSALERFIQMVEAQGGDTEYIRDTTLFKTAEYNYEVTAKVSGFITRMNTAQCGVVSGILGAGRETKDSTIDYAAGIVFHKKTGDYVKVGDILATLYSNSFGALEESANLLLEAYFFGKEKPEEVKLVFARVSKEGETLVLDSPIC